MNQSKHVLYLAFKHKLNPGHTCLATGLRSLAIGGCSRSHIKSQWSHERRTAVAVVVERSQVSQNRKVVSLAASDSTAILFGRREVAGKSWTCLRAVGERSATDRRSVAVDRRQSQMISLPQPVANQSATGRRPVADRSPTSRRSIADHLPICLRPLCNHLSIT